MPAKLPDSLKSLVIQQWLQGIHRNDIAAENGLSAGAVTNIVNEWRRALGFAVADALRELAVTMKKIGITAAQCAIGFRAAMILNKIGVKEDDIEYFISEIYNRCKNIGLSAENIAVYLQDLFEFSKKSTGTSILPISNIEDYLIEKREEKGELQQQIEGLKKQIEELESERSIAKQLRDEALQQQEKTASDIQWYSDLKAQLGEYGIPVDDISIFAKIVDGINQYGYDVNEVLNEFSNLKVLTLKQNSLQQNVQGLEVKLANLNYQCNMAEATLNFHNETISKYTMLESIGFGLKELTLLSNIVDEIAYANNIPPETGRLKFFKDIEEQYDKKLGFESKLQSLRTEIDKINQDLTRYRIELSRLPSVGSALAKLMQSGLREQDIIDVASIFERYFIGIDRQSLISELDKYGGLKAAIQKLSEESSKLNNKITSLKQEKQEIEVYNQNMVSGLVYLSHKISFLQGYIDSLRNEIAAQALISVVITHFFLKSQIEDLQRTAFYYNNIQGFLPLIRASNGDSTVPTHEIKLAVIKALEILIDKVTPNSELNEILSNTKLALMHKGENN